MSSFTWNCICDTWKYVACYRDSNGLWFHDQYVDENGPHKAYGDFCLNTAEREDGWKKYLAEMGIDVVGRNNKIIERARAAKVPERHIEAFQTAVQVDFWQAHKEFEKVVKRAEEWREFNKGR